jgi:hypothetical protein
MNQAKLVVLTSTLLALGGCGSSTNGNQDDDAGASPTDNSDTISYRAALSGAAEMPSITTTATGSGTFVLQVDGVTLTYDLTHNVKGATSVALRLAFPGETGPVLHALDSSGTHVTGKLTITRDEASALDAGNVYVEVASRAQPNGEIRGTLAEPGAEIFVTQVTGAQDLPAVESATTARAAFIMNAARDSVRYHFDASAAPSAASVRRGIHPFAGPVAFSLSPVANVIDGTLSIVATDASDLEDGHWYVSLATAADGSSELRGQLLREGEILTSADLSGDGESPPVTTSGTGGAQVVLAPDKASLRYEVIVAGIVRSEIDLDDNQTGSTLYGLSLTDSVAKGVVWITSSDSTALLASRLAINVETADNPNGELLGILRPH